MWFGRTAKWRGFALIASYSAGEVLSISTQSTSAHSHAIAKSLVTEENAALTSFTFSFTARKSAWLRAARIARSSPSLESIRTSSGGMTLRRGSPLEHPPESGGSQRVGRGTGRPWRRPRYRACVTAAPMCAHPHQARRVLRTARRPRSLRTPRSGQVYPEAPMLRRWLWLLWAFVLVGAVGLSGLSPAASGSRNGGDYAAEPVPISSAAVVDMRALARVPAPAELRGAPEPKERDEAGARVAGVPLIAAHATVRSRIAAEASPLLSASFLAQTDKPLAGTKTESPPDTTGAVGREKLMSTLNSNYVIQRKTDGKVLSTVTMTSFWGALGTHRPFDPRVLYDPYSDRWLVSAADDPVLPTSRILYGISETGVPQGRWRLYAIDADPANATF